MSAQDPFARVLVIDDEDEIRRFLRISLKSQGYQVLEAATASAGIDLAATQTPDLVVLDLGLPDADGKSVLEALHGWCAAPVMVLSVRASESEKVRCLDLGATDYMTKPFGVQEFLARVRALLRRPMGDGAADGGVYDDGHLRVDLARRAVFVDDQHAHLTRKEMSLLMCLLAHPGRMITQNQLLKQIWGPSHAEDTHYLRVFIGKLRRKLGDNADEPRYIETEPGIGYRFIDRRTQ